MTIHVRTIALAFASLIAAAPLAARADNTPLPGQPGSDTSVGQELRGAPYTVMMVTSTGMTTQRQITAASAAELMKHSTPLTGMMVLVHDGKAYAIANVPMKDGKMPYDVLDLPENLIYP
jgi:hypothetical protein